MILLSSSLMAASKVYPEGNVAGAVTWTIIGNTLPNGFKGVGLMLLTTMVLEAAWVLCLGTW